MPSMDVVAWFFGLLALLLAAALVWVLLQRSALTQRALNAEEAARRAQDAEKNAEARYTDTVAQLRNANDIVRDCTADVSRFKAEVDAGERKRRDDLASQAALHESELKRVSAIAREQVAAAEQTRDSIKQAFEQAEKKLREVFDASAGRALQSASEQFIKQAGETFRANQTAASGEMEQKRQSIDRVAADIKSKLDATAGTLAQLQKDWAEQRGGLTQQLTNISAAHQELRGETGKLVKALREPHVRGRYGEIQLKRVAELAGMRAYCDFVEQDSTRDADENLLRPDMIVRLPNGRELVVDAKANLKPYIDAIEASTPEEAEARLIAFADGVADQAVKLSKKNYWSQYQGSPQFVVMFVPGDQFVDAALSRRPDLLDAIMQHHVILASPSTLIGLLRAVAVGFQERLLSEKAQELVADVKELNDRLAVAAGHLAELGRAMGSSVDKYNKFVASYERRVLPQMKKIEASGTKGKALEEIKPIDNTPRSTDGLFASPESASHPIDDHPPLESAQHPLKN